MNTLAFVDLTVGSIAETIGGFFPYGLLAAAILIGTSFIVAGKRWFGCTMLLLLVLVLLNALSGDITIN